MGYIYIYIERERERERVTDHADSLVLSDAEFVYFRLIPILRRHVKPSYPQHTHAHTHTHLQISFLDRIRVE